MFIISANSFPIWQKFCHQLRPLLKKNEKLLWTENHQTHFEHIKTTIANATENTHFNPTLETRVKCDASRQNLGAALEQLDSEGWKTVAVHLVSLIAMKNVTVSMN